MAVVTYFKALVSAILSVGILVILSWQAVSAPGYIGQTKVVVNKVFGKSLSRSIRQGDRVYQNQRIRTGRDSSTDIRFLDESKLIIGELSDVLIDRMIYDANKSEVAGSLRMLKGVLRFASAEAVKTNLQVKTPSAVLGIRGTVFDILASPGGTQVAVHEGAVQVESASGTVIVAEGQVYQVGRSTTDGFSTEVSQAMKSAVSRMLAAVGDKGLKLPSESKALEPPPKQVFQEPKEQIAVLSPTAEEAAALKGRDLENILVLDLSFGRVMIEMMPAVAPNHVNRIKALARQNFYDGLKFHSVKSGFAAETGDPSGTGRGGSGQKLRAELSKTPFIRGIVGMKRDATNLDTADSQFFILMGRARHLEGKYTAWARVIHGMVLVDRLRQGSPPSNPDRIKSLRVAAEVFRDVR
ncbi:MAG: hypothetical protein CBD27_03325 [Rhodospirillaceae bacterium TMED167]|nr:hypothetical protein [Rhodospirillaceae bacterium]OUW29240.1 MAG: hypothetical protein CBD27_03325 [Rhodospirillaceae bacterium TMED167]